MELKDPSGCNVNFASKILIILDGIERLYRLQQKKELKKLDNP